MGEPPVEAGADHDTDSDLTPAVTVGAPGAAGAVGEQADPS
jgi:hypothetical protein